MQISFWSRGAIVFQPSAIQVSDSLVCYNYLYVHRLQRHVLNSLSVLQCCVLVRRVSQVRYCSWLTQADDRCLCNTQEPWCPESTPPGTCKHEGKSYFCFICSGEGTELSNPFYLHIRRFANNLCSNIRTHFSKHGNQLAVVGQIIVSL